MWLGPPRPDLLERGSCSTPEEIAAAREKVEAVAEWVQLLPITPLRAGLSVQTGTAREDGYSVHRFAVPPEAASPYHLA